MKNKRNKMKNSHYKSKRGLAIMQVNISDGDDSFEGLKKAVAYVPGCLGKDNLDVVVSYLLNRALDEGYIIKALLVWDDVYTNKTYTQKDFDDMTEGASKALSDWYYESEKRPFEAIFKFHENHDVSVFGYHDTSNNYPYWLGMCYHPDNVKAIFKPNSDELKSGIIPAYWVGRDEGFYKWCKEYRRNDC